MLAELAIANGAFNVIKSAISNGKELAQFGKQIGDWIGAEENLKQRNETEKKSVFNKIMGKETSDFESFLALDQIKEQRRQLESHMRLYGRPGLFDSWVVFQAEARKSRREAAKRHAREHEEFVHLMLAILAISLSVAAVSVGAYFWYINSIYY